MTDKLAETKLFFENSSWYLGKRSYYVQIRSQIVQELLKDSKFESILDIGCGDGSISLPLLAPGTQLTLMDLSQNMLDLARSRVPSQFQTQVKVLNGDFLNVDLPSNAYDLVICLGVLSYVDLLESFFEKIRQLLKPGGILFIECTDGNHPISRFVRTICSVKEGLLGSKDNLELHVHSAAVIAAKFREMGFENLATYRYSTPLPISRRLFSQKFHHKKICAIYGNASNNRMAWLGNECLFQFKKSK